MGPQAGMTGRRIRWQSVGRIAAVALAVIVAIASLPALLGSDAPPPLPDDVGLVPTVTAAEAPAQQASAMPTSKRPRARTMPAKRDRKPDRDPPRPNRTRITSGEDRRDEGGDEVGSMPVRVLVPAYAPPPPRGEFGIEP